jgi:hypothetical protein
MPPAPASNDFRPRPYIGEHGTLVIPMAADPKYHWWKPGGQKVEKTLEELRAARRQVES